MTSQLPMVHARILLIEVLRDTAPSLELWSDELLADARVLARDLAYRVDAEVARRSR